MLSEMQAWLMCNAVKTQPLMHRFELQLHTVTTSLMLRFVANACVQMISGLVIGAPPCRGWSLTMHLLWSDCDYCMNAWTCVVCCAPSWHALYRLCAFVHLYSASMNHRYMLLWWLEHTLMRKSRYCTCLRQQLRGAWKGRRKHVCWKKAPLCHESKVIQICA